MWRVPGVNATTDSFCLNGALRSILTFRLSIEKSTRLILIVTLPFFLDFLKDSVALNVLPTGTQVVGPASVIVPPGTVFVAVGVGFGVPTGTDLTVTTVLAVPW